nr:hypothetical protein [Tanacetum cinerariifolium]
MKLLRMLLFSKKVGSALTFISTMKLLRMLLFSKKVGSALTFISITFKNDVSRSR